MSGEKAEVVKGGKMRRSNADGVWEWWKEHPLMNPLVLETVFDYCTVKDLQAVRQVSPLWRDCARKKWNKSVKLRITQVPEKGPPSNDRIRKEKYKRFLQMVEPEDPLGTRIQGSWTTFCDQLKTLELVRVTFPNVQALRNALFHCFSNLENLGLGRIDILQVGDVSSEPGAIQPVVLEPEIEDQQRILKVLRVNMKEDEYSELPLTWMEILSHFPLLERIEVETSINCMRTQAIFQAVNQIREEDPSKLKLRFISFWVNSFYGHDDNIPPATLATLMDRRLHLETLEFMGLMGRAAFTALQDIIQVHAGTLKTLALNQGPDAPFCRNRKFPQLPNVENLAMLLHDAPGSIEFVKFTPKLRKLILMSVYPENQEVRHDDFKDFPVMLSALKDLHIYDSGRTFSTENWRSLMQWTPNLENLKIIGVDNSKFSLICEGWPKLVTFQMRRSEVDGCGITGWDEKDVKRLDSMRRQKGTGTLPIWRPITVPRANVTDLKNLEIFTVNSSSEPPIKLGRAAGFHGIEMLPNLRRLCFQNYKVMPRDRDYWKELLDKFPYPL